MAAFFALLTFLSSVETARAQSETQTPKRDRPITIRDRADNDVAALGRRLGSFVILPSAQAGITYESNVFAEGQSQSAAGWNGQSQLRIQSDWSRHALAVSGFGNSVRYFDFPDQNEFSYGGQLGGELNISQSLNIFGDTSFERSTESRLEYEAPLGAAQPVPLSEFRAMLRSQYQGAGYKVQLTGRYDDRDYDDVLRSDGSVFDQDERDRHGVEVTGRVGGALLPFADAFVEVRRRKATFPTGAADGDERSLLTKSALVGLEMDSFRTVRGEVAAGIQSIDRQVGASAAAAEDGDLGYTVRSELEWLASPITNFRINVLRAVTPTSVQGANGVLRQEVRLGADHELRRNIVAYFEASYEEFQFDDLGRTDERLGALVRLNYTINEKLSVNVRYNYLERESSGMAPAPDFTSHSLSWGLQIRP